MSKEDYEDYCRTQAWMQLEEEELMYLKEQQDFYDEMKERQVGG